MVKMRLLRGPGARVLAGVPGVEVGVEVQDADGAPDLAEGAEGGQGQAVVAAEGEQPRLRDDVGGDGGTRAQLLERRAHLPQRHRVVHRRRRDVPAVQDLRPALVRVDGRPRVEAPERRLPRRGGADRARAEAGACFGGLSLTLASPSLSLCVCALQLHRE